MRKELIKSLKITGYRSYECIELSNLGIFNLFIGPNNSGKSNLFRFLYEVVEGRKQEDENLYWDQKNAIKAKIEFEDGEQFKLECSPEQGLKWEERSDFNVEEEIERRICIRDQSSEINTALYEALTWRQLPQGDSNEEQENHREGMKKWLNYKNFIEKSLKEVLGECNVEIIVPDSDLYSQIPIEKIYKIRVGNRKEFQFFELGQGVKQVVYILTQLYVVKSKWEGGTLHFLIDDFEMHLHPAALVQLCYILKENFSEFVQFFITTHSPTLIDQVDLIDSYYSVTKQDEGKTDVKNISHDKKIFSQLLDSLGVRASQILQSNLVIWVEGPSDRIYIKSWIENVDSSLIEGKHYSFILYGGSLLASYSLGDVEDLMDDESIVDEFIDLLSMGRYAVIVCDRDFSNGQLKPRVQKLLDAKKKAELETVDIWITEGKEIENYIPEKTLLRAISSLLKGICTEEGKNGFKGIEIDIDQIYGFDENIFENFAEYFSNHFEFKEHSELSIVNFKSKIKRNLEGKKLKIARFVTGNCNNVQFNLDLEEKVRRILDCIYIANGMIIKKSNEN